VGCFCGTKGCAKTTHPIEGLAQLRHTSSLKFNYRLTKRGVGDRVLSPRGAVPLVPICNQNSGNWAIAIAIMIRTSYFLGAAWSMAPRK
jgi:hypothetical protein